MPLYAYHLLVDSWLIINTNWFIFIITIELNVLFIIKLIVKNNKFTFFSIRIIDKNIPNIINL